jgi:hypothetical protein
LLSSILDDNCSDLTASQMEVIEAQNVYLKLRFVITHHAERLVNPKVLATFLVTDFGYPRAYTFRKYQNLNRSPALVLPTFFKT